MKKTLVLFLSLLLLMLSVCSAQAAYTLPANLTRIEEEAFAGNPLLSGKVTLPGCVESVGDGAFADTNIHGLWLPESIREVGSGILSGSDALYATVKSPYATLADGAFDGVEILISTPGTPAQAYAEANGLAFIEMMNLIYQDGFAYYVHGDGALELIFSATDTHSGDIVIPSSVNGMPLTMVGGYAFSYLDNVTSIALPETAQPLFDGKGFCWPDAEISFYDVAVEPFLPEEALADSAVQVDMDMPFLTLFPEDAIRTELLDVPEDEYLWYWYVSDDSIISVEEGVITALAPGKAAMTTVIVPAVDGEPSANESGVTAYYGVTQVTVVEPSVVFEMYEDIVNLNVGQNYYTYYAVNVPSQVAWPELTFETSDPSVVEVYDVNGAMMLMATGEGSATVTATATLPAMGGYDAVTSSASFTVNVTDPALTFNQQALFTYTGVEHDLYLTQDLPEGATVAFTTDSSFVTIEETGREYVNDAGETVLGATAVIGNKTGDCLITCTVTYADGTTASADIPVHILEWLSWGESYDRDYLIAGWEYHPGYRDIIPELNWNVWGHDIECLVITAQSDDENVITFEDIHMDEGFVTPLARAGYPGTANVTYTADLLIPVKDTVLPGPVVSDSFVVTVNDPYIQAYLDTDYMDLEAGDERDIGYWFDSNSDVHSQRFTSTDESVFTVDQTGSIRAIGAGRAELIFTVESYGVFSEARATIEVFGYTATMEPAQLTLRAGESASLKVTLPEGLEVYGEDFGFDSHDGQIVSVDSSTGLVTGLSAGTTKVVYHADFDGVIVYAETMVTVTDDQARASLNRTYLTLGCTETFQLELTTAEKPVSVVWSSTNDSAVSVDENGLVTSNHNAGSNEDIIFCEVTFADGETVRLQCYVEGPERIADVTNMWGHYALAVGDVHPFYYLLTLSDGVEIVDEFSANAEKTQLKLVLVSEDESVVAVNQEDGTIEALTPGLTRVYAKLLDAEGRVIAANYSFVNVDTPIPSLDGAELSFEYDHIFFDTPPEGETWGHFLHTRLSDESLRMFYYLNCTMEQIYGEENFLTAYEDGGINYRGEGSAYIYARLAAYEDNVIREEPVGVIQVTVGTPELSFAATRYSGEAIELNYGEELPSVNIGDIVTVTLENVPEDIGHDEYNWDYDDYYFRELSRSERTLVLQAQHAGTTHLHYSTRLACDQWFKLESGLHVEGDEEALTLGEPAVQLAIGETVELHPGFPDWEDGSFAVVAAYNEAGEETDASEIIEIGEEFPSITAVGKGCVELLATVTLNGETVEMPAYVTVVESEWRLINIHVNDVMVAGEGYDPHVEIEFNGYHCPEMTFSFSDDSLMHMHYEEWFLHALEPGMVTVTVTAEKDGRSESVSKDILIVRPELTFGDGFYYHIRPNASADVTLVNNTDKAIQSVEWALLNPQYGTVSQDESGMTATVTIGDLFFEHEVNTLLTATVTFEDGTTASASAYVNVIPDHEVWANVWQDTDYIHMSTEAWGEHPWVEGVWVNVDTNAAPDEISYTWQIEDESVVTYYYPEESDGSVIHLDHVIGVDDEGNNIHSEGGVTTLSCRVQIGEDGRLFDRTLYFTVEMHKPTANLRAEHEAYFLSRGDNENWTWINWIIETENAGHITAIRYSSDDNGIVMCDQFGNICAVRSGETTVRCELYIEGHHVANGSALVFVEGPSLSFWQDSATIAEGESLQLIVNPELNGAEQHNLYFHSDNEAVARVNENGLLYGVAPGRAIITCGLETSEGHVEAQFVAVVTGEEPAFSLSTSTLKLYPGASYTFPDDLSGYDSVVWSIEGHENIFFDEETQTVSASHNDDWRMYSSVITCTVTRGNETYTANCHAVLLPLTLDICNYQFGDGAWHEFRVGDTLDVWEAYLTTDSSVEVTIDIWTDDENIAVYNPEIDAFEGISVGNTMAYYKVTGSNGETHTCSAMLRVVENHEDVWPERIDALHADHAFVVDLNQGERGFPFVTTPEYSGCELYFRSGDESILSFSGEQNDGQMRLHNVGRTTVTVEPGEYAPEGLESAQGEVLVLDPNRIVLAPVDENGSILYDLELGKTYQLTFTAVDGGILWEEDDVASIVYDSFWNSEHNLLVSEEGELNIITAWADSLFATAMVTFKDGTELFFNYDFRPVVAENQGYFTADDTPIARIAMPVDAYSTNIRLAYNGETIVGFTPASTDASVAELVWNEGANEYFLHAYGRTGDVTVTGTATLESGETVTASMQVVVLEGEAPVSPLHATKNLLTLGEEISFYFDANACFTIPPFTDSLTSSNESVLEPVLDEYGTPTGSFRAVGIGEAVVTAAVHYGGVYSYPTCTICVTDYPVAFLEEAWVGLRPDAQHTLVLREQSLSSKDISSVVWSIDDDSVATFETVEDSHNIILRSAADSGETTVRAQVTATDGSVIELYATVHITTNDEIWVAPWHEDLYLTTVSWADLPTSDVVWQFWHHNASHFDEPDQGTDKAWIEWEIEDESIAVFDGFFDRNGDEEGEDYAPWNNGPIVKAVSVGDTLIKTHLTLTDKDGNFLAECWDEIPVHVTAPEVSVHPEFDTYEVKVGHETYIDWRIEGDGVRNPTSDSIWADDPSIVLINRHGGVQGLKPGETTVHYSTLIGEETFTASAQVVVTGPELRFGETEITLNAGDTYMPELILNANGYEFDDLGWYIANPDVVSMTSDGVLYAHANGTTFVEYEIFTEGIGYIHTRMLVTVTGGETPAFALSSSALEMYPESGAKLQIVANTDAALNEETIVWSSTDESIVTVDQEGNLTAASVDRFERDEYATIVCDAQTEDGQQVQMLCFVTVHAPGVVIDEHQFGTGGAWYQTDMGGIIGMWESYTLLDPSLTVEVTVTVDDEGVLDYYYDPYYGWPYFRSVAPGATDAHYTVTASNGETYTRSARLLVDQDTTPESLHFDEGIEYDRSIALCLEDGEHWFDFYFYPEYTGTAVFFSSSDESVVIADPSQPVLYPQNPGHAMISVTCPDMPELSTEFNVTVIREENVRLVAEDGRTTIGRNDSVQLVFETTDGVMWREYDAVGFEFESYYDNSHVWVDENGVLHTRMNWDEDEITGRGVTWFMPNRGVAAHYSFAIDGTKPYFYLSFAENGWGDHFNLAEGSGFHLHLNTNQDFDPATLVYSSSNPEAVDFMSWDEEAGAFHVHALGSGEAELTVTIPECGMTATFPVVSFIPTEISKHISMQDGRTVLYAGEEIKIYDINDNEDWEHFSNFDERITYESSNPAVIDTVANIKEAAGEDPEGRDWMTLRALTPGTATITMTATYANYPELVCTDSVTITVLPLGEIVVNGAAFASDYLQLSTEAWGCFPTASEMTVNVDTNAPANQITYTWAVEKEGVVAMETPEGSDGRTVRFASVGDITDGLQVSCRVQVGDVYDQTIYGYIDAFAPTFSLSTGQEVYDLNIGDNVSADWTVSGDHLGVQTRTVSTSSDESVVLANPSGFLQCMGEGTATVTRSYYYNGAYAGSKTITVNVTGGYSEYEQKEITLNVGETYQLNVDTNLNASDIIAENWFTSDESVADITDRNLVYAIGTGRTTVRHLVSTASKTYHAECVVNVIGEAEDSIFTLSDTTLDVYAESSYKLRAYLNGRDVSSQATWSTNDSWLLPVDDTGLIVLPDMLYNTMEGTVTAEYHYQNKIHRASCHIIVHGSKVGINGHQFNENNSLSMNVGDRQQITDFYQVNDESLIVTETFTSDNESVAKVEDGYIVAVGKGTTTLYYTISASNGESYTRPLTVMVETGEPVLTGFAVSEETLVITGETDRYISITPNEKTSAYHVEYVSRDENVLTMSNHKIVPVNPGRTFVDVTVTSTDGSFCETKPVEVLVLLDTITMEPEDGRTTLMPGDTVQMVYKGEHLWREDEVKRITYHNPSYLDNEIILTDDGLMTVIDVSETTSFVINSTVVFKDDSHVDLSYAFNLNRDERYFYVTLSTLGYHALIANPGESVQLCLYTNTPNEVIEYTYASSDKNIASVSLDAEDVPYLNCHAIGEAVITTTAHFTDGTTLAYETPVQVISSDSFYMKARATERVIHVGESTYPYPELTIPNTFSPGLTFTSSDPSTLGIIFHEDGAVEALALEPGVVDITIGIANMPDLYDVVTIYIVEAAGEYDYAALSDGTAALTAYNGAATDVTLPTEIGGMQVSAIDANFDWNTQPVSVYVPDGLTLGAYAFSGCTELTSVRLPADLAAIPNGTFYQCTNLPGVDIPDSVTTIGDDAFYQCSNLGSITFGT
ncbi:MAG: Ig-like domain-containing protein [Clostridia bacterium]|nr:Ig-like domain-containing protein [Clostridia bacterium]